MPVEFLTRVRVYSNGAVIIPKEVRARLNVKPGEEMLLVMHDNSIRLIPSGMTAQVLVNLVNQTIVNVLNQAVDLIRGDKV